VTPAIGARTTGLASSIEPMRSAEPAPSVIEGAGLSLLPEV